MSFYRSVSLESYRRLKSEVVGDFAFLEKNNPLREGFQNFIPKGFIATQIHVLCAAFVKFGSPEIGKVVHYLPHQKTKFRLALSLLFLRGSRPKSARASGKQCTQSAPNFIQIGLFLAELYSRTREHYSNAP